MSSSLAPAHIRLTLRRLSAPLAEISALLLEPPEELKEETLQRVEVTGELSEPWVPGERLLLTDQSGRRWRATVAGIEGERLQLHSTDAPRREARRYPRILGALSLELLPARGTEGEETAEDEPWLQEWLRGAPWPEEPLKPRGLIDFNPTGIGCTLPEARPERWSSLQRGGLVLCELGLTTDEERWRSCARVVRYEGQALALQLLEPPAELQRILSRYLSALQEALLEDVAGSAPSEG